MKSNLLAALGLLAAFSEAQAAEPEVTLQVGAAVKNISEVHIAPGKSTLSIVAEGAGRIVAHGEVKRFSALCTIVDTLAAKEVVTGVGDCEFKSTEGDTLYAHFQTLPGYGDRGRFTFSDGSGNFARISGSVPVEVSVNPAKVGKMVFFVESVNEQRTAQ